MASTTLQRTPASSGSNTVFTMSMWIKRNPSTAHCLWSNGGSPQGQITILASDKLIVYDGSSVVIETNRVFRDPSAWWHMVLACDASASSTDKVKLYINGVLETSFGTDNRSSFTDLNNVSQSGQEMSIGSNGSSGQYLDGSMSHVQFVDGLALAPTEFGEVDSTSGIWKIKTGCYATPGTNGFCLKMEDSSNMDLDSSSNALTFTTSGDLTATKDNPSNNFGTWNKLIKSGNAFTSYLNGNTRLAAGSSWCSTLATLGFSAGKFYWEFKGLDSGNIQLGVGESSLNMNDGGIQDGVGTSLFSNTGGGEMRTDGSTTTADYGTLTSSDILGVAVNMDDKEISIYKNGAAIVTDFALSTSITLAIPIAALYNSATVNTNFGNGYFATTAVTSAEADGAGRGAFEYAPPTGFYALCTKNIKAYGG